MMMIQMDGFNNNSPRYEYIYTVAGDAYEGWRVVDQKLLSEHKLR